MNYTPDQYAKFIESLPSDLAEHVKGFMRAGMDAAYDMAADYESGREQTIVDYEAFRRLSEATEVKP